MVDGRKFKKKKMDVYILSSDHETTAVVEYYKRGHPIPPAVEFQPVNPLVNTMEPIFIFRGPHANRIAVRASTSPIDRRLHLCGPPPPSSTPDRHPTETEEEKKARLDFEKWAASASADYIKRNSVSEVQREAGGSRKRGRGRGKVNVSGRLRAVKKSYIVLSFAQVTGAWLTRFRGMDASCIPILVEVGLGKVLQGDEQPPDTNQDDEDATTEETVSDMDPERTALYETTYKYLVAEQPGTHERLRQCSHYGNDPVLNHIISMMREGFRLARKADTSKLKKSIVWIIKDNPQITWDDSVVFPSLDADTKIARGLLHPSIAPLMCPASFILRFKSDDEDVREKALDDLKRAKAVTHSSLPGLLYDYRLFDPTDMYQGLFRGYTLTRAWRNLHKSPAATMNLNDASEDNGNAAIAGVKSVTPESIAYVAVQVYFALSTQTTWRRTCGKLDLYIFYRNLIKVYEAGKDSWKEDLLNFFNKEVFKDQDAADDEPEEGSDMATILAQAKACKEAAAAAAATAAQSTT
ncbi:hypothetical protein VNI00_017580 [Paramarasmius palmivorus]|uniref:Uncharacterized protein n=1 Tax=Paramarasmius palmivorus TaxID=297713 RepID=A0AAW0B3W1_9AGAR